MKLLTIFLPILLLAGGGGVSGDFGGADCAPYQKISLKSDGTAYITMLGSEISAPYKVDGDKISIIVQGGAGIVFTKKGDTLETGHLLGKVVCKKL